MSYLYITEYQNVGQLEGVRTAMPIAHEPAVAEQRLSFTTSAASAAFNAKTRFVRLLADADCYIEFSKTAGASPTATASHQKLTAGVEYWRAVRASDKVAAYDGTS